LIGWQLSIWNCCKPFLLLFFCDRIVVKLLVSHRAPPQVADR
jgi:hypothetical protein